MRKLNIVSKKIGVEGPNGNVLVGYEWRTVEGEKWSDYEGGLVATKVSDWDRAEKCESCGRRIVHIFWVQDKDTGAVNSYGKEHLHQALGYRGELSKGQIDKFKAKFEDIARMRKVRKEELLNRAEPYFYDSLRSMRKVTGFSDIADKIGWTTFINQKDGKFITVLNDNKEDFDILRKEGFKEISPNEARKLGKFKEE
jgi:hypothetical protein